MRKFVRKNRPKRKYTKKAEVSSISPVSKTAYGMLPVMIMIIVFMTTMVISLPFRDSFSHIRITIQAPEFSLSNPLIFFQTLADDIRQISLAMVSAITFLFSACAIFFANAETVAVRSAAMLNPLPLVIFIGNFLTVIGEGIATIFNAVLQTIIVVVSTVQVVIITIFSFITILLTSFGQLCLSLAVNIWHAIFTVVIVVFHTVISLLLFIAHSIVVIGEVFWSWFIAISVAIITAISNFLNAVLRVIEIPFKILYSFWLQIKPYVDIFGRHAALVGDDFNKGFISLVKIPTLLSSAK